MLYLVRYLSDRLRQVLILFLKRDFYVKIYAVHFPKQYDYL